MNCKTKIDVRNLALQVKPGFLLADKLHVKHFYFKRVTPHHDLQVPAGLSSNLLFLRQTSLIL
jgi:hypothetical protein